jgi:hypothetical protein
MTRRNVLVTTLFAHHHHHLSLSFSIAGAFLIPFMIMLVLEGIPLFLIELGMGQRMRLGALGVWNTIHPWLGGIGISSCIVTLFVAIYYNVIITWCIYYFINSFRVSIPFIDVLTGSSGWQLYSSFSPSFLSILCRGRNVRKWAAVEISRTLPNACFHLKRNTFGIATRWTLLRAWTTTVDSSGGLSRVSLSHGSSYSLS